MLFSRIQVFILMLLVVTTGYHLMKDRMTWNPPVLPPSLAVQSALLSYHSRDPTILYAFHPISPVKTDSYRPLQKFVYRRRSYRYILPMKGRSTYP